jgi:uncharacterized cysteine cluster protein YcgN (CxxCxxCC family)
MIMKTKIKKLCATIVTVILSVICAGCGDLSALKTKYIAELDAYYQEIEAMHLEYTTALIENEIRTGQNKIQQLTTTSEILMEVQHTKQRVQVNAVSAKQDWPWIWRVVTQRPEHKDTSWPRRRQENRTISRFWLN